MTEELEQYIEQRYNSTFEKVLEVKEVLIEQYGEDLVDVSLISLERLKEYISSQLNDTNTIEDTESILNNVLHVSDNDHFKVVIRFPKVRITNEYDKFIDIYDLFVKFFIKLDGKLNSSLEMIRTTYPIEQLNCGYRHSHLPGIQIARNVESMKSSLRHWTNPCLGSGPIRNTMETLRIQYDRNFWSLFAYELSKYVTIESLQGGPYRRLEEVNNKSINPISTFDYYTPGDIPPLVQEFVDYYASKNKFKFSYKNNSYQLGESFERAWINLSNEFIIFINHKNIVSTDSFYPQSKLLHDKTLVKYSFYEGKIYDLNNNLRLGDISELEGTPILTFKNVNQYLHIMITDDDNDNSILLLNVNIYHNIILKILSIINFKYGTNKGTCNSNKQIPSKNIIFI